MLDKDRSILVVKSRKGFEKRRALVEAAFDYLTTQDLPSLTVAYLCEVVGLKRNSFYTHFADLGELLNALSGEMIAKLSERIAAAYPQNPNEVIVVRERLKFIIEISESEPKTARVLHQLYTYHRPTFDMIQAIITERAKFWIEHGKVTLPPESASSFARILISIFMDLIRQIGDGNSRDVDLDLVFNLLARMAEPQHN